MEFKNRDWIRMCINGRKLLVERADREVGGRNIYKVTVKTE